MSLRESPLWEAFFSFMEKNVLPTSNRTSGSPNYLTMIIGLGLYMLVPIGFYVHPLVGLAVMMLSCIADNLDRLASQKENIASPAKVFIDSTVDRISDFFYLGGFWVLFWPHKRNLIAATAVIFSCMLFCMLLGYVKACAQGMGIFCKEGIFERGLRTIYLIIWALIVGLLPEYKKTVLWTGLLLFWMLAFVTVIQRIRYVLSSLNSRHQ